MFGYDAPRLHAALNDLPAALLFVTVLFDLGAWGTRRQSLKAAALWTLWAGVIGGWAAVIAGLIAEDTIEHGEAIHDLMETHETLALATMAVFTVVLAYKLLRRGQLAAVEELALRALSVVGFAGIVWTGIVGGKLMFEHGAGIPSARLRAEMENREAGHQHRPGEANDDAAGEAHDHAPADSATSAGHTHPAGTQPHKR